MTDRNGPRRPLSNLQLRIVSAVVLGIVALSLTWLGGAAFRSFSALIGAAIFFEWSMMSRTKSGAWVQSVSAVLLGIALVALLSAFPAETVTLLLAAAVALSFAMGMVTGGGRETAAAVAYSGAAAFSLAFLRAGDKAGLLAILYLFAVVWTTDIAAYFVGRAIGGPKLAPSISPGKTWSGAIGGAAGGVLGGIAVAAASAQGNVVRLALIALALSVVAQGGDLFESAIKRYHGVKDSGRLIPGHGGVMDRVDGLVAAAFALYLIGAAWTGLDMPAHGLFSN